MKSFTIASAFLVAAAAAQPHGNQHHRRHHEHQQDKRAMVTEIEWVTETAYVTKLVDSTTTVWVTPGQEQPTTTSATEQANFIETSASPIQKKKTSTTEEYVAPEPTTTSVYVPPTTTTLSTSTTSTSEVYVPPVETSTSVYVAPEPTTTSDKTPVAEMPAARITLPTWWPFLTSLWVTVLLWRATLTAARRSLSQPMASPALPPSGTSAWVVLRVISMSPRRSSPSSSAALTRAVSMVSRGLSTERLAHGIN